MTTYVTHDELVAALVEHDREHDREQARRYEAGRKGLALVTLDTARFDRAYASVLAAARDNKQRSLQAQDSIDQRAYHVVVLQLTRAARRITDLGKQRAGNDSVLAELFQHGVRLLDRFTHDLAPSRSGEGSVGRSSASSSGAEDPRPDGAA